MKPASFISNPSPSLRNIGSSTSNMYQPKLFKTCAMSNAQNGIELAISRQGTFLLFFFPLNMKYALFMVEVIELIPIK